MQDFRSQALDFLMLAVSNTPDTPAQHPKTHGGQWWAAMKRGIGSLGGVGSQEANTATAHIPHKLLP